MVEQTMERQFEIDPHPMLSLNTVSGRVRVRGGEIGTITMHASKHGSSRAVENTRIECLKEGNRVRIETRGDKTGLLNLSRSVCAVDYDVVVPSDCVLHLQSVSADIHVHGLSAPVQIQTVSGEVVLRSVSGECQITTVSGDIVGSHVAGALTLRTTSGDVQIQESQFDHFNLNSVSGDFSLDTPLVAGHHYLAKTVSGDLQLLLPAGTGATVQMKSISGEVDTDLPAQVIKSGRRHWQGRINGGGAHVEMNSVSGDLRIGLSSGSHSQASAIPMVPGAKPELPEETDPSPSASPRQHTAAEVLRSLERGEISVEEAMAQLEALRDSEGAGQR